MRFDLDSESLILTCPPDASLREIEAALSEKNLTLGYLPERKTSTIGEALAKGVPNLWAERYGEIGDLCVALKAVHKGRILCTKNAPRSATGPDFKRLLATGGGFRPVEIRLRVSPRPERRFKAALRWKTSEDRLRFLTLFWGSGIRPSQFQERGKQALNIGLEGPSDIVKAEEDTLKTLTRRTGGTLHARS